MGGLAESWNSEAKKGKGLTRIGRIMGVFREHRLSAFSLQLSANGSQGAWRLIGAEVRWSVRCAGCGGR